MGEDGRYGIVISQQGLDVDRAADYQKVLDSRWKFLNIAVEKTIDVTISVTSGANGFYTFPIYEHKLGFLPAFEFFVSSATKETNGQTNVLYNGYLSAHGLIRADSQKLYCTVFYSDGYPVEMRLVGKLRIFALDILTEYQAPQIPVTTTQPSPPSRYGAKFVDLNLGTTDIEDEGMYGFTLNTRGKQMSIHKHGTVRASGGLLTVVHNTGYPPSYMVCYMEERAGWTGFYKYPHIEDVVVGGLTTSYYLATPTATDITFKGIQSTIQGRFGYIILKDPVEIAG